MGKLVVISGPSGAGKGTVVKELINVYKEHKDLVYLSISCATRSPREGEVNGVSYYFITEEEFKKKIKDNDLLEYNLYANGRYYGTPKSIVFDYLNKDYDVILEIDINGYKQVCNVFREVIGIFLMPPSLEELERRLRNRGTETEEGIKKRLAIAEEELKEKEIFTYTVVNEDGKIRQTADEIYAIIKRVL